MLLIDVRSNKPRINNTAVVRRMLKRRHLTVKVKLVPMTKQDTAILDIHSDKVWPRWPSALEVKEVVDEDDFRQTVQNMHDQFQERGESVFAGFLLELAPHLMDPLIVQASKWDSVTGFVGVKEWHVSKDDKEVQTKEMLAIG